MLPDKAYINLAPGFRTCRIVLGMWQISGAHGDIEPNNALRRMLAYHDAGFTTWDLADHYGPAEDYIGVFRDALEMRQGRQALATSQAMTKWCPAPAAMTKEVVETAVKKAQKRMHTECIDVMQLHWWDYTDERYFEALEHLSKLQKAGAFRFLALTNFDTAHMEKMISRGIHPISNQIQYSMIDTRPEVKMVPFCLQHNIKLLTYGTLLGGLLSDAYVGKPEPRKGELTTASLRKYKTTIDQWGGWTLFQELLGVLSTISKRLHVSIADLAIRWVLDRPAVGGVIVGVRLGVSDHLEDLQRVFGDWSMDELDLAQIDDVLKKGHNLFEAIGDCGNELRK